MEFNQLIELMRKAGAVGTGGAGFPSYAKLNKTADTIILNCAECEPLFRVHRQLLRVHAYEIMQTLQEIADTVGAQSVIIAVKHSYTQTVEAVKEHLDAFPHMSISYLPEFYPVGDEVITVYEATGRVVNPGAIPISVGCIVYNVETVYNIYRAWKKNAPVTHKYITVTGEVQNPCTLHVPLGITFGELIKMVGGTTCKDPTIIAGGPMTGRITSVSDVVTKTSNAILVMPKDAYIVQKRLTPITIDLKRAAAACCHCNMCTDLCSRNLLGHPIDPARLMRATSFGIPADSQAFMGVFSCSSCGLCEMYSCGQGLNPRSIIAATKAEMQKNGITPPKGLLSKGAHDARPYRTVPMSRLIARLGLKKYDVDAPLIDVKIPSKKLKVMLAQGIGAPAKATVAVGDTVKAGDVIGEYVTEKLSVSAHAPMDGRVREINEKYVLLDVSAKR